MEKALAFTELFAHFLKAVSLMSRKQKGAKVGYGGDPARDSISGHSGLPGFVSRTRSTLLTPLLRDKPPRAGLHLMEALRSGVNTLTYTENISDKLVVDKLAQIFP